MTYHGCVLRRGRLQRAVMMGLMEISEEERARRRAAVDHVRANSALEGLTSHEQARADQEAYARGEIDLEELFARIKAYR